MGGRSCKACKKSKKGTDSSTKIVENVGRPIFNATNYEDYTHAATSAYTRSETTPESSESKFEEQTPSALKMNEISEVKSEYRDTRSRSSSPPEQQPAKPSSEFRRRVHRPLSLGEAYASQVPGEQDMYYGSGRHSHMQYRRPPPSTHGTMPATENQVKRASPNLYKQDNLSHISFSKEGKVDLRKTLDDPGDRLVVVMFYENECENCEPMRSIFEELLIKYPEVMFLEANVAYNELPVDALKIKFLPTFIVFRNHHEVGRVMTVDAEEVEEIIHLNHSTLLYEGASRLSP